MKTMIEDNQDDDLIGFIYLLIRLNQNQLALIPNKNGIIK